MSFSDSSLLDITPKSPQPPHTAPIAGGSSQAHDAVGRIFTWKPWQKSCPETKTVLRFSAEFYFCIYLRIGIFVYSFVQIPSPVILRVDPKDRQEMSFLSVAGKESVLTDLFSLGDSHPTNSPGP